TPRRARRGPLGSSWRRAPPGPRRACSCGSTGPSRSSSWPRVRGIRFERSDMSLKPVVDFLVEQFEYKGVKAVRDFALEIGVPAKHLAQADDVSAQVAVLVEHCRRLGKVGGKHALELLAAGIEQLAGPQPTREAALQ